jgi:pullulanase
MNSNKTPQQVDVPEGLYTVACHDGMVCADDLGKMQGGKVTVAPQSALIMYKTE